MNRSEALAAALSRAGHTCTVAGRRVYVDAPAFTLAHVRLDELDFACVFDANKLFAQKRGACAEWSRWASKLRTTTGSAFPALAHLPLPADVPEPVAAQPVAPVDLSSCLHAYAIGPLIHDRCRHAYDEIREGRFAVYAIHAAPAWSSADSSDLAWPGPSISWHAWAQSTAVELGAARGWTQIEGLTIDEYHPHRRPVERILLETAEKAPAPAGLVALDLRGLAPRFAEQLVTALVDASRERGDSSACVLVVDNHAGALLTRIVDLDCSPRQNGAQQRLAVD